MFSYWSWLRRGMRVSGTTSSGTVSHAAPLQMGGSHEGPMHVGGSMLSGSRMTPSHARAPKSPIPRIHLPMRAVYQW